MKISTIAIVYVNADETQTIGTKDFQEMATTRGAELQNMVGYLSEWLEYSKDLTSEEIFHLTEEERAELWQEYEEQCVQDAAEELLRGAWHQKTIEVEIEV